MVDGVLWRRLTRTDFNAINGEASPYGRGGGARHVSLGVSRPTFPIEDFLNAQGQTHVTISAVGVTNAHKNGKLVFATDPDRRRGEWLIRDQFNHRHSAWQPEAGFPTLYDREDPPYILVFRIDRTFYARYASASDLKKAAPPKLLDRMLMHATGIAPITSALLVAFKIKLKPLLEDFENRDFANADDNFDPNNLEDGRSRVFAAIHRRQGQAAFRESLVRSYAGSCAITGTTAIWTLEAAHIVPYRGPKTNSASNGLLLRADIHTLFDLGLISVEPISRQIKVSSLLTDHSYAIYDGEKIAEPIYKSARPSLNTLQFHFDRFQI